MVENSLRITDCFRWCQFRMNQKFEAAAGGGTGPGSQGSCVLWKCWKPWWWWWWGGVLSSLGRGHQHWQEVEMFSWKEDGRRWSSPWPWRGELGLMEAVTNREADLGFQGKTELSNNLGCSTVWPGLFYEVTIFFVHGSDNLLAIKDILEGIVWGKELDTVTIMRITHFSFILTTALRGKYYLHFADEETKMQRFTQSHPTGRWENQDKDPSLSLQP